MYHSQLNTIHRWRICVYGLMMKSKIEFIRYEYSISFLPASIFRLIQMMIINKIQQSKWQRVAIVEYESETALIHFNQASRQSCAESVAVTDRDGLTAVFLMLRCCVRWCTFFRDTVILKQYTLDFDGVKSQNIKLVDWSAAKH